MTQHQLPVQEQFIENSMKEKTCETLKLNDMELKC